MSGRAFGAIVFISLYQFRLTRSRRRPPGRHEFESKHMGTTFRVVLYAADTADRREGRRRPRSPASPNSTGDERLQADSELMRLCRANDAEVGEPVKVSDDLFDVLQKAQELSKKSDGAFDVTVGPVVQLWRHARRTQQLPDPKELADGPGEGRLREGETRPGRSER